MCVGGAEACGISCVNNLNSADSEVDTAVYHSLSVLLYEFKEFGYESARIFPRQVTSHGKHVFTSSTLFFSLHTCATSTGVHVMSGTNHAELCSLYFLNVGLMKHLITQVAILIFNQDDVMLN